MFRYRFWLDSERHAINSLIILDSLAYSAEAEVESRLASLEPLFCMYLREPDER